MVSVHSVKRLIITGPHSITAMPVFILKSDMCIWALSTLGAHLCIRTTHIWLKWELKKSGIVIVHLPRQPLFHFHRIRASQSCHIKHTSLGANISTFHLPRQAGRIFHLNELSAACDGLALVGAAANEATSPSHVYETLGMLIRCIAGVNLRISQPGRHSTRANMFRLMRPT